MNSPVTNQAQPESLPFSDTATMLEFVTRNWKANYVTEDLISRDDIEPFAIRPFFMVVRVDAPTLQRFKRLGQ